MQKISSSLESPAAINEKFKVNSVPFFITFLNLLCCGLNNFTFKALYFPCEKSKMIYLVSSVMKDIVVCPGRSRFLVKLICCTGFGSASSALFLLKSVAINL